MQARTVISLENHDMANPVKLRQAVNLLGGKSQFVMVQKKGREIAPPPLRALNMIETNSFTMDDVREVLAFISERADEVRGNADALEAEMQSDPDIAYRANAWSDGIRATAKHAERLAEEFRLDLELDLAA